MSVRIATLEKDLEYCRIGKAEAEIAVQYLAQFSALKLPQSVQAPKTDKKAVALEKKLVLANKDRKILRDRLERANALLCLINVSDPSLFSSVTGEDTTLLDESDDDIDDGSEDGEVNPVVEGSSTAATSLSDVSDSYIVRFTKRSNQPEKRADQVKDTVACATHDAEESKLGASGETLFDRLSREVINTTSQASDCEDSSLPSCLASCSTSFASECTKKSYDEKSSTRRYQAKDQAAETQGLRYSISGDNPTSQGVPLRDVGSTHHAETFDSCIALGASLAQWQALSHKEQARAQQPPENLTTFFASNAERATALQLHQREAGAKDTRFPDFFRYGVQYTPTSLDSNYRRTIVMSNLSSSTTMTDILAKVRGGMILEAKLLDTLAIKKSNTAIITFLREGAAEAYASFAKEHHIAINDKIVQVSVVPTPTWPIPLNIRKALDHGQTRCCEVTGFSSTIDMFAIRQDLNITSASKVSGLEGIKIIRKGVLGLRFSSIWYANQASGMFLRFRHYRGCRVRWVDDPCAQGVETLLAEDGGEGCIEEGDIDEIVDVSNSEALSNDYFITSEEVAKVEPNDESESRKACGFQEVESLLDSVASSSNPAPQPTDDSYGRLSAVEQADNAEQCKGRGFREEEPAPQDVTSPINPQPLFTKTLLLENFPSPK
ncbi:MAG: hypothetical protein Q9164_006822 [Protoblastenia rupestris]